MPILLFYKGGTPALMYSQHFRVIYFNVVDQQGYEGEPLSLSLQSIFGCFNCCSRPIYHCVYVDIGPMDSIQSLGLERHGGGSCKYVYSDSFTSSDLTYTSGSCWLHCPLCFCPERN
jgi:hypothetical protein